MIQDSDRFKKAYYNGVWLRTLQEIYKLHREEDSNIIMTKVRKRIKISTKVSYTIGNILEKFKLIQREKRGKNLKIKITPEGIKLCQIIEKLDNTNLTTKRVM